MEKSFEGPSEGIGARGEAGLRSRGEVTKGLVSMVVRIVGMEGQDSGDI